ncbi:unnamed protein product [Lathyrus sativus]|nr:unnamed protein product [Lathyrus sativus]
MMKERGQPKKNKVTTSSAFTMFTVEILESSTKGDGNDIENGQGEESSEGEVIAQTLVKNHSLEEEEKSIHKEERNTELWVDIISGNRIPANAMNIDFVAPKIIEGE